MVLLSDDLRFRGLIHQTTEAGLLDRLGTERLTVYTGFDPTADSLHVGNLLQLCVLRRLQLAGHRPIALAGGGTGLIGDPGGRTHERALLSEQDLRENLAGIRGQLERFLDFGDGSGESRALLLDNAVWLSPLPLFDFLREVGKHFTVNQMVAKESVKARLERPGQGISYTEFSYMLLQAYDFLRLHDEHGCRLQVGGSDQWGNITMGIELVRKVRGAEVWGLTTPLVLKADGTKFGKSETGTVWLDERKTSPYQLYQFFLRSEDAVVGAYLRYFTFLDHDEIVALDEAAAMRPEARDAQRALAREVCVLVHGADEAARAERTSAALFGEEIADLDERALLDAFSEAPATTWSRSRLEGDGLGLLEALVETGLVPSKGKARTTIDQGGAYVNNRRMTEVDQRLGADDLLAGGYVVLRRGRKDYHLVRFA